MADKNTLYINRPPITPNTHSDSIGAATVSAQRAVDTQLPVKLQVPVNKFDPKEIEAFADPVNHPTHYTSHPSGVECIQITEHMGFNLGNAVKYVWRADLKHDAIEDLEKAVWYLNRELAKRRRK